MADASIDELLEAIETVKILQETLDKHDKLFVRIGDKLDEIERRLDAVEAAGRSAPP